MADTLWFVDPSAGSSKLKIAPAPRPIDLAGKVVGMIDNTKEQADVILATLAEELRARYAVKDVIIERKQAFSKPATPAQLDALAKRVHVAAAAVGG
jgi:hypothetical protein